MNRLCDTSLDQRSQRFLVTGALLLAVFAVIRSRSANPLLPLRIVTDRNRGASFGLDRDRRRSDPRAAAVLTY